MSVTWILEGDGPRRGHMRCTSKSPTVLSHLPNRNTEGILSDQSQSGYQKTRVKISEATNRNYHLTILSPHHTATATTKLHLQ